MATMRERHLQLAMDSRGAGDITRAKLHEAAAEAHRIAHLSEHHAARAAAATGMAFDAGEWDEGKHKRADNGQFGSGGGNAMKPKPKFNNPREAQAALNKNEPKGKSTRAMMAAKSEPEGLTDADHEHNKTYKTEGKITHRAGQHYVMHSPMREKRGMAGHAVFHNDQPKALSSHKTHEEAKLAANKAHAEQQAASGEQHKPHSEGHLRGMSDDELENYIAEQHHAANEGGSTGQPWSHSSNVAGRLRRDRALAEKERRNGGK